MIKKETLTKKEIKEEKEKRFNLRRAAKTRATKFQHETRKAVTTAIVAAFGFLMALAWRDVISYWVNRGVEATTIESNLAVAVIITIIGVVGIGLTTKIIAVKDKEEAKK